MAFEVVDYATATCATLTQLNVRVLQCASARCKYLFPVWNVSGFHLCALALKLTGAQPAQQDARPLERLVGPVRQGKTYPLKKLRSRSSIGNVLMAEPLLFALRLPP